MDLFKKALKTSRDRFGTKDVVRYSYEWLCAKCGNTIPIEHKDGKILVAPPSLCGFEGCKSNSFKLNYMEKPRRV